VLDNVKLGLRIRQMYGPDGRHAPRLAQGDSRADHQSALDWLARLGLAGLAGQYPGQLSGGQRQRAAIARTLVLQPDLLLMDEPFSSLDAVTRLSLRELTLGLWREQGFSFVVVTHAIEEAAHLGQYILILGEPPHQQPEVIVNPCFGEPELAESDTYRALLRELRARIAPTLQAPAQPPPEAQ
jgi:NitT/TauT family transport system ATP-binding protein